MQPKILIYEYMHVKHVKGLHAATIIAQRQKTKIKFEYELCHKQTIKHWIYSARQLQSESLIIYKHLFILICISCLVFCYKLSINNNWILLIHYAVKNTFRGVKARLYCNCGIAYYIKFKGLNPQSYLILARQHYLAGYIQAQSVTMKTYNR